MRLLGPTILCVDDQASSFDVVAQLLARDAYTLTFASGTSSAIALLREQCFDLILCNDAMAGLDGLELCRAVKAHTCWRFTPIILLTDSEDQDDMIRGLEAGADDILVRPLDRTVLRARVRALLRIRHQYVELRTAMKDINALINARRDQVISRAKLSERERAVLELLLLGRSHQDIAEALSISERTSKFHLANILQKLGAESRSDLFRLFC